jgi:uncharacterized protein
MTTTDFRQAIVEYIREQAKPVDKFSHQERLYALTHDVGQGQTYDDDIVFAAVWMHDLGVFVGHRPEDPVALAKWDMKVYAVKQVPPILRTLGFPPDKIPAVIEVIQQHQPGDHPTAVEAVIVRDADILEQLGAVGILRNVCKIGRDTRFRTFSDVLTLLEKNLKTLPAQLRLPAARKLAERRVELLKAFLHAARAEGCMG